MVSLQPGLATKELETRRKPVELAEVDGEGDNGDEGLEEEAGCEVRQNKVAGDRLLEVGDQYQLGQIL